MYLPTYFVRSYLICPNYLGRYLPWVNKYRYTYIGTLQTVVRYFSCMDMFQSSKVSFIPWQRQEYYVKLIS
jgi:hypothetical protein